MKKRRITLSLDEDVVEALEGVGARSVSAAANDALRAAVAIDAHRRALLAWLDELDERHGAPTPEHLAAADAVLDEASGAGPAAGASDGAFEGASGGAPDGAPDGAREGAPDGASVAASDAE